MSLLLLGLACLCGAARGEPTTLCDIPESAIECLRSAAVVFRPTVDDDDVTASDCWRGREYATPDFSADGIFVATDVTIRDAVSLWCSNRTAAETRERVARRRAAGGPPATELAGQRAGVRDF